MTRHVAFVMLSWVALGLARDGRAAEGIVERNPDPERDRAEHERRQRDAHDRVGHAREVEATDAPPEEEDEPVED